MQFPDRTPADVIAKYGAKRKLEPGMHVEASDRVYVTDKNPSTLRRRDPKVRGKAARRADKKARRAIAEQHRRANEAKPTVIFEGHVIDAPRMIDTWQIEELERRLR